MMAAENAYVVRTINDPLFFTARPPHPGARRLLLRRSWGHQKMRTYFSERPALAAQSARVMSSWPLFIETLHPPV
jgi:hypothetical protein